MIVMYTKKLAKLMATTMYHYYDELKLPRIMMINHVMKLSFKIKVLEAYKIVFLTESKPRRGITII